MPAHYMVDVQMGLWMPHACMFLLELYRVYAYGLIEKLHGTWSTPAPCMHVYTPAWVAKVYSGPRRLQPLL